MNLYFLGINIVLALALAPLLNGLIKKTKAGLQNRQGPGLFQPWFDILKYLGRENVVSEHASWIFRYAPYIYFGAHVLAFAMLPTIWFRSPLAAVGDAIVVVGLLALARFFISLAALDTGSNFGGMGASRELAFAALVEPAFLLMLFAIAIPVGSTSLDAFMANTDLSLAKVLAFGAMAILVIAETGRIPVDNPDTHLELTMVHEGMLLEYSGRPLGLLLWATHVKQMLMLSLMIMLFLPWGIAQDVTFSALMVGLAAFLGKLILLGLALALVETANVKLRIFRVPGLLGVASLLGMLAVTSIYVIGG